MSAQNKKKKKTDDGSALRLKTQINSYWAEIFALNIIAVLPLYLNSKKYIELTGNKTYYLWTTSIIMLAALALITLSFMGLAKSRTVSERLANTKIADWAAMAYLLFVWLSAFFSPMPNYYFGDSNFSFFLVGIPEGTSNGGRYDGLITITIYVLAYFTVSRLFVPRERDWVIFASFASMVSLIGILQYIGYDIFELYPYGYNYQTTGVYPFNYLDIIFRTTLGNVDIVSPFVCTVIGFFLALYMRSEKKVRFLYLATVALTFAAMIMCGADGGIVGAVAALALLFVFNITDKTAMSRMFFALSLSCLLTTLYTAAWAARDLYNETGEIRTLYWSGFFKDIWFLAAAGLLVLGLAVHFIPVWIKGTPWKAAIIAFVLVTATGLAGIEVAGARVVDNPANIIYQARETMHMRFTDSFGSWRGFIWKRAMKIAPDHLLFGTGPDTFEYAFRDYQAEASVVTQTTFDKAHNDYLQILVCNGIFALIGFLTMTAAVAVKAIPKVWENTVVMACVAGCAAYLVQAFFGISTPMVAPMFFVILGITRGLVYVRRD